MYYRHIDSLYVGKYLCSTEICPNRKEIQVRKYADINRFLIYYYYYYYLFAPVSRPASCPTEPQMVTTGCLPGSKTTGA